MKPIYIELPDELYERLESFNLFYGAKSKIVRKAIEEFLDKLEGVNDEQDSSPSGSQDRRDSVDR